MDEIENMRVDHERDISAFFDMEKQVGISLYSRICQLIPLPLSRFALPCFIRFILDCQFAENDQKDYVLAEISCAVPSRGTNDPRKLFLG